MDFLKSTSQYYKKPVYTGLIVFITYQDLLGPAGLSAILADKPAGPLNCVFTAVTILLAVCTISSKKTVF